MDNFYTKNDDGRYLFTRAVEFTLTPNATGRKTLVGKPIVYSTLSSDRGGYKVRLLPNSAKPTATVFALYQHSYNNVLARSDDNSLRFTADPTGVTCEIDLPDTSIGRDVEWLCSPHDGRPPLVRGMSFAMIPGESTTTNEDGQTVINFSSFEFDEVTITPIPAFRETQIAIRNEPTPVQQANKLLAEIKANTSKELSEHLVKLEKYRVGLYGLYMAEFQQQTK